MKKIRLAPPGELLLKEFIRPNGITVYRVAKDSGIPQSTLQLIVSGKRPISAETALRLGVFFGIDAQFWLNLQSEFELRLAKEAKLARIQKEVRPLRTPLERSESTVLPILHKHLARQLPDQAFHFQSEEGD